MERLFTLLRHLKAQGHAIVYISHFIEEVKEVSDRFVVLRDGRNVGEGVTSETRADARRTLGPRRRCEPPRTGTRPLAVTLPLTEDSLRPSRPESTRGR